MISEFVLVSINQSGKKKRNFVLARPRFSSTSFGGGALLARGCQSVSLTGSACREAATTTCRAAERFRTRRKEKEERNSTPVW